MVIHEDYITLYVEDKNNNIHTMNISMDRIFEDLEYEVKK
jgi:hypothetical protein